MEPQTPGTGVGIKPLLSLKRHYRVSLWLFVLILIVGLPVVWIKGKSTYHAEATFHVAPRYMKNLETDAEVELQSNSQYREFVNQLQNTVVRYDVLERAIGMLQARGIDTRPPALTPRQHIELLQRLLIIRAIPDTYMVRVRMEGGPAEKAYLHDIVNAVMASFLEITKTEQIYGSGERLNVLRDTERTLRSEIADMDAQRAQLGERLGLTTFNDGVQNPYDIQLSRLRDGLASAEVDRKRAEAMYTAFKDKGEVPTDMGRSLMELRQNDLTLVALRTETAKRIAELQQKIDGLGPRHPAREPAEAEVKRLEGELKRAETEFVRTNQANIDSRLAASVQQRRLVEEGIRQSVINLESQAGEFAQVFHNAMQLTRDINERYERLQLVQKRLNYIETESNALGFVRLVTPALAAEMPQGPGKTKLLLMLILLAGFAAAAAPSVIDLFYNGVRSVNDAEKLVGMPAAGWQIRREDLPTRMYAEEQSRRFAATLIRIKSRQGRQVFAFSSVKARGGVTTTVLDTASTLVGLGARVLIVEANSFTPFEGFEDLQPGLGQMLQDGLCPDAVVHTYTHHDVALDVVSLGTASGQGLKRLDRLRTALAHWQTDYEFVLFDLPPLLLSADAEMLIEQLGQVFMVIPAESVSKGEIRRAKRLLQKIDPEAVGLFVTGIPLFRGAGYMEESILETVTRGNIREFMVDASWRLQWEQFRTLWVLRGRDFLRRPFSRRHRGSREQTKTNHE